MTVTGIEIRNRRPFDGGRTFGDTGSYERIEAVLRFAVDPAHPLNSGIVDLDCADRGPDGQVHFEADLTLLQPSDSSRGNGNLLCSVVNRGRTALLPFSFPPPGFVPEVGERIEAGDGFLLERGWTVALCGWQWDVVRRPGSLGLAPPLALEADGTPASTTVTVAFQPLTERESEYLGHWPAHPNYHIDRVHLAYPAADMADPAATLTIRGDGGGVVARARWQFGRMGDSGFVPDPTWITLEGGFESGRRYELSYRTNHCPVTGTGLLAIRDAASFLRFGGIATNPIAGRVRRAFAHGVSQTGRFLRDFLLTGCNVDEARQQVFDGVFVQIAGARRGEFNFRGAQPSAQYVPGPGHEPPFGYVPNSVSRGTLLDRQRATGGVPKIFEVNTANEYWRSNAILVHSDPAHRRDEVLPPEVRAYLMAGCQHGPGFPLLTDRSPLTPEHRGGNALNMLNYTPLTRAALISLERWVTDGTEPPGSNVPTFRDESAVERESVLAFFRTIPNAAVPEHGLLPELADAGGRSYPSQVPRVDADGNDCVGIRLPQLAVPVATFAGWNVRHPETGGPGEVADMIGSTLPFALTTEERTASGDPRPAITERYADRDAYLARVREAADALAGERWLLEEDIERSVMTAGRIYDRIVKR